jgi:hypothetical protein
MKLKFDINVEKENGESACVGKKRRRKREREESNITVKREYSEGIVGISLHKYGIFWVLYLSLIYSAAAAHYFKN